MDFLHAGMSDVDTIKSNTAMSPKSPVPYGLHVLTQTATSECYTTSRWPQQLLSELESRTRPESNVQDKRIAGFSCFLSTSPTFLPSAPAVCELSF